MAAEALKPQVSISEATESEENEEKAIVTPTSAEEKSGVILDTEEADADTAIGSSQLLGVF